MTFDYDIIIVGASIAGSSTAIALAKKGHRILILDRAVFPRHKCCGEGIMPQGVAVLEELGVLSRVLARGVRFRGIRFRSLGGVWAEADFPPMAGKPAFGIAMRRYDLDDLILQKAEAFPNVTVRQGFRVLGVLRDGSWIKGIEGSPVEAPDRREVFRAPLTIGADGRNSVFHTGCGVAKTYLRRKRYGVTGHLTGVEAVSPYVEVLSVPGGEIFVAPCGERQRLVALLLEKQTMSSLAGDLTGRFLQFLRSAPGFGQRMEKSELIPPVLIAGPLGFDLKPCYGPGFLLIGDSAGFLDPITGEGMTLTLKSVQAAVPLIHEAFTTGDFGAAFLARYAEERSRLVADLVRITRLALGLSQHKLLANRAIRRLSRDRALFGKLLGVVTGTNRYAEFSLGEKLSLLLG